jgi:predicted urease superfamily metal-dependent hydrolase
VTHVEAYNKFVSTSCITWLGVLGYDHYAVQATKCQCGEQVTTEHEGTPMCKWCRRKKMRDE